MITANQTPEQIVGDEIDKMLLASGWQVQSKKQINLAPGKGVAVREYQINISPADYILYLNKKQAYVIYRKPGICVISTVVASHFNTISDKIPLLKS